MPRENDHSACVDAWLSNQPSSALPSLLVAAVAAVWARTATTLGTVTLMAITQRVLYIAAEKFPRLSTLQIDSAGSVKWRELDAPDPAFDRELVAGMRFVLVELLTVLGNLTGEILTPALHAELDTVGPGHARRARSPSQPAANPERSQNEDPTS